MLTSAHCFTIGFHQPSGGEENVVVVMVMEVVAQALKQAQTETVSQQDRDQLRSYRSMMR